VAQIATQHCHGFFLGFYFLFQSQCFFLPDVNAPAPVSLLILFPMQQQGALQDVKPNFTGMPNCFLPDVNAPISIFKFYVPYL